MLEANRKALEQHNKNILDRLDCLTGENCQNTQGFSFSLCKARDGHSIDRLENKEQATFLQSQYRPLDEAERFVKQYEGAKKGSTFLFLGFGNGYIVRELTQKLSQVQFVFYEPSIVYFLYVLGNYDLSDILINPSVHLYIKDVNDSNLLLEMYVYVNQWNWHSVFLETMPKYQDLYPEIFQELGKIWEESIIHGKSNYLNYIEYSTWNLENAVYNLPYIYKGDTLSQFEGILQEDFPVIIVAGGPSLQKNVHLLKQYKDKAFIFAVDRVAAFLSENDILPHAFATVDARKPVELFDGKEIDTVPWFLYTTANHKGIDRVKTARLIFCSTIYKYPELLFDMCGGDIYTLANGGTVATVCLSIALKLGSRNIILIGQDLAYSDNKTHAGKEREDIDSIPDEFIYVPGFFGEEVPTDLTFKAYIDWYEAYAKYHPEITFINATEGGAYIDGMSHMTLEEAMARYSKKLDVKACLDNIPPLMNEEKWRLLDREMQALFSYMKKIKREVPDAVTNVERGIRLLQQYGFAYPELDDIEKKMESFRQTYESYAGRTLLDLGIAKSIQEGLIDIQFTNENPTEEMLRLYNKMLAYFQEIQSNVEKALPMMEDVMKEIDAMNGR